jgi:hypothetical protein
MVKPARDTMSGIILTSAAPNGNIGQWLPGGAGGMDRLPQKELEKLRAAERLRYGDLVSAIIAVTRTPLDEIGALEARLRHLRTAIGLPSYLPQPGRGKVNDYCVVDGLELLLALRLEKLNNTPPTVVGPLATQMTVEWWRDAADERDGKVEDLFVVILPLDNSRFADTGHKSPRAHFFRGISLMAKLEDRLPAEIVRVNVSSWARRLIAALEQDR